MKIRSRWLTKAAAWFSVASMHALLATCRKVHIAPSPQLTLRDADCGSDAERLVLCVWHDALLMPTFCSPRRLRNITCCLVSRHQDGSYLADAMAILGYSTVRGSTNRGGAQAVRQLLDDTAGKHIVITPDGPRGPRREVKPGIVFVASQTGRRIGPSAYVCRSAWRIQGSWTDMVIPKPFTTVYLVTGQPITVPPNLSKTELAASLAEVQRAMDELDVIAADLLKNGSKSLASNTPVEQRAAA